MNELIFFVLLISSCLLCLRVGMRIGKHQFKTPAKLPEALAPVSQNEIHQLAVEKGWWKGKSPSRPSEFLFEKLFLIVTELAEAVEEYRKGKGFNEIYLGDKGKPEGFGIEIADARIRIDDLCGYLKIDVEEAVRIKHNFNKTRPYRHGGKKA